MVEAERFVDGLKAAGVGGLRWRDDEFSMGKRLLRQGLLFQ